MISKCKNCNNFLTKLERCKFCSFEYDENYNPYAKDDWDILNLKEEDGWEHIQILDRLHYKNIDCLAADIWYNDVALLIGNKGSDSEIAKALNVHQDIIYNDYEHGLVILNLFQEKFLRGLL